MKIGIWEHRDVLDIKFYVTSVREKEDRFNINVMYVLKSNGGILNPDMLPENINVMKKDLENWILIMEYHKK